MVGFLSWVGVSVGAGQWREGFCVAGSEHQEEVAASGAQAQHQRVGWGNNWVSAATLGGS